MKSKIKLRNNTTERYFLSTTIFFRCFKRFQDGGGDVEDNQRPGHIKKWMKILKV